MLYTLHILLAAALFVNAFTAAIHSELPRKVPYLSFFYFGWSIIGQVLALPLLLLSTGSLYFSLFSPPVSPIIALVNAASICLFTRTLYLSWQGSKALCEVEPNKQGPSAKHFILGALFPFQLPKRSVKRIKNITYGPLGRRNQLDIYTPKIKPSLPMPVLIHVHGGGWILGRKHQQAQPLIQHMAAKGWLVVDMNYRLGPKNKMPTMVQDILRAVAWVKENIHNYHGDPSFVALTGGSAGGHLVALAGLAAHIDAFKPGFEKSNCTVNACVPVYGVYDFLNRNNTMTAGADELQSFLTKLVMPGPLQAHQALWDQVSPMGNIHSDAPPMLIMHGRHDALADFESAKIFAQTLKQTSNNEVTFVELPGAQHAYDVAHNPPTPEHIRAIYRFLERTRMNEKA